MKILSTAAALGVSVFWPLHAAVDPGRGCPPSLVPNGCFEEFDDAFRPIHWEFPADPSLGLVSLAERPSPAGDRVLWIGNGPLPPGETKTVVARVPLSFDWNPATEDLRLSFLYNRDEDGSQLPPLVFALEVEDGMSAPMVAGDPPPVEQTIFARPPFGFDAREPHEWREGVTWAKLPRAAFEREGTVMVTGFRILRAVASPPVSHGQFIDRIVPEPVPRETPPDREPVPVDAAFESIEMELATVAPRLAALREGGTRLFEIYGSTMPAEPPFNFEVFLDDIPGEIESVAPDIGIVANFVVPEAGWYSFGISIEGNPPHWSAPLPVPAPIQVESLVPPAAAAGHPAEMMITGAGFDHGLRVLVDSGPLDARVVSPTEARFTLTPGEPGEEPMRLIAPWGQVFSTDMMISRVPAPVIQTVDPPGGQPDESTTITITGENFGERAEVRIGGLPVETTVLSPTLIEAVVPPAPPHFSSIEVVNPDGVGGSADHGFRHIGRVPGDITGDGRVGPEDLAAALRVLVGGEPPVSFTPEADQTGDGRVGPGDAHRLLRLLGREPEPDIFIQMPMGSNEPKKSEVEPGEPVGLVLEGLPRGSGTLIDWGDGHFTRVINDGTLVHEYDLPGEYEMRILDALGNPLSEGSSIRVLEPEPVLLEINFEWSESAPVDPVMPGLIILEEGEEPPLLISTFEVEGPDLAWEFEQDALVTYDWMSPIGERERIKEVSLEGMSLMDLAVHSVSLSIPSGEGSIWLTAEAGESVITLSDYATTVNPHAFQTVPIEVDGSPDCGEIEREWNRARARKTAQQEECERLRGILQRTRDELRELQSTIDAAGDELERKQAEKTRLRSQIEEWTRRKTLEFENYGVEFLLHDRGEPRPEGSVYLLGIAGTGVFEDLELIAVFPNWQAVREVQRLLEAEGKDFFDELRRGMEDDWGEFQELFWCELRLRRTLREADNEAWTLEMVIARAEQLLEDCQRECDELQEDLDRLTEELEECLEGDGGDPDPRGAGTLAAAASPVAEFHASVKRYEARLFAHLTALGGQKLSDNADRLEKRFDRLEAFVLGRSGTAEETQADLDLLQLGRDTLGQIQSLVLSGEEETQEARGADAAGDPDAVTARAEEAEIYFGQARDLMTILHQEIGVNLVRVEMRPRRQCGEGEADPPTRVPFCAWDEVTDIHVVPHPLTPDDWQGVLANRDAVLRELNGLLVLALQAAGGGTAGPPDTVLRPDFAHAADLLTQGAPGIFAHNRQVGVWISTAGCGGWRDIWRECEDGIWRVRTEDGFDGEPAARTDALVVFSTDGQLAREQLQRKLERWFAALTERRLCP